MAAKKLGDIALTVGLGAKVLAIILGSGSILDQAQGATGPVTIVSQVLSLFTHWPIIGLALIACKTTPSPEGSKAVRRRYAVSLVVYLAASAASLLYITTFVYALAATFLMLYFRHLAIRGVAFLLLAAAIAWPTLYSARQLAREQLNIPVDASSMAIDRLRYDLQITRSAKITPPIEVGQPEIADILRHGLVPRLLDPERRRISTGTLISNYLAGRTQRWSYTFLPIATLFVLEGSVAVVLYYALLCSFLAFIRHRTGPMSSSSALCIALLAEGPLNFLALYPDSLIGALQGCVSLIPLFLLSLVGSSSPTDPGASRVPVLRWENGSWHGTRIVK